ncbi:hypothetical protein M0802_009715 [Mischocyttarus mexicanus]|nr:hypothetical protein M0802_009715 [Mischocyttarus mexicanus]
MVHGGGGGGGVGIGGAGIIDVITISYGISNLIWKTFWQRAVMTTSTVTSVPIRTRYRTVPYTIWYTTYAYHFH